MNVESPLAEEFHAIVRPAAGSGATDGKSSGFGRSYEQVAEELALVPRLHIEPDGSFVWVSSTDVSRKINGQITDDGQQVMYIEFRGRATAADMQPIFAALQMKKAEGQGPAPLTLEFQMLPSGQIVGQAEFQAALL